MAAGTIREYEEISTTLSSSFTRDGCDSNLLNPSDTDAGVIFRDSDTVHSWQTSNSRELPPDLSVFCEACCRHVALRHLGEHRLYHRCLSLLGYGCYDDGGNAQHDWQPEHLDELVDRRRELIYRLTENKEEPVKLSRVRNINEAFEFLKNELEGFQKCPRVLVNLDDEFYTVVGEGMDMASGGSVRAIGVCSTQNTKWKSSMEDRYSVRQRLGGHDGACFVGLFDGYGGTHSAQFASDHLHEALVCELSKSDARYECTCQDKDVHEKLLSPNKTRHHYNEVDLHRFSKDVVRSIVSSCEQNLTYLQATEKDVTSEAHRKLSSRRGVRLEGVGQSAGHSVVITPPPPPPPESSAPSASLPMSAGGVGRRSTRRKRHLLRKAFERAHNHVDSLLSDGKRETSRVRWSGCSTLCALVVEADPSTNQTTAKIHISNAGHIHGVLIRADQYYILSKDHSTNDQEECGRVKDEGGLLSNTDDSLMHRSPRLNGVLPATRGLGSHGDASLKKCIISKPSFTSVKIDEYAQFLILATSGLWNVLEPVQVSNFVVQILQSLQTTCHPASPTPPTAVKKYPTAATTSLTSASSCRTDDILKQIYGSHCDQGSEQQQARHPPLLTDAVLVNSSCAREVARYVAATLVKAALMAGSRDNITVMCLLLPGCVLK